MAFPPKKKKIIIICQKKICSVSKITRNRKYSSNRKFMMWFRVFLNLTTLAIATSSVLLEFPQHDAVESIKGLIERRLGAKYLSQITLHHVKAPLTGGSGGSVTTEYWRIDDGLTFSGTSATALASSIQWYLNNILHLQYDWFHEPFPLGALPEQLPAVDKPIHTSKLTAVTYYENVCTVSYSMWSWDWETWEKHIDWMALNGINVPLAFTGQEKVWQQTFENHFNISRKGMDDFFSGAAFLAWNRMGNLRGSWGNLGPLPQEFINNQAALQTKILKRMRSLGMIAAGPSFAGYVPKEMKVQFPSAKIKREGNWGNFADENCCVYYVEPTDPLFQQIAVAFLTEYKLTYPDSSSLYQCDTYNEMDPESYDPSYLRASSKAVMSGIRQADENGIWLMQGWLFQYEEWTNERIEAYLSGVSNFEMIILDLYSEVHPQWERTKNYFGKSWIYCVLHNFGGNLGMRGDLPTIASDPLISLNKSNNSMVGIGLTMEGIYQNYPVYDLTLQMNWVTKSINIETWIQNYSIYRYGKSDRHLQVGWEHLLSSVYNCTRAFGGVTKSILEVRPHWDLERNGFMPTAIIYDTNKVFSAWGHFLEADQSVHNDVNYKHDLVDITKQYLSDYALKVFKELQTMYESDETTGEQIYNKAQVIRDIIIDTEWILSSHDHFLVGRWLYEAHQLSSNNNSSKYYDYQGRNQVTRWGENNHNSIGDYASKAWSGLMKDYYGHRWNIFLDAVYESKYNRHPLNRTKILHQYDEFEQKWNFNSSFIYPNSTTTTTILLSSSSSSVTTNKQQQQQQQQKSTFDISFILYNKYKTIEQQDAMLSR